MMAKQTWNRTLVSIIKLDVLLLGRSLSQVANDLTIVLSKNDPSNKNSNKVSTDFLFNTISILLLPMK